MEDNNMKMDKTDLEEGEVMEQPVLSAVDKINGKRLRPQGEVPKPYKKCKYFSEGRCFKGKDCTFLHEDPTKSQKEELCKYIVKNTCFKGEACPYSHDTKHFPCKLYHCAGTCQEGSHCLFSHDKISQDQLTRLMKETEPLSYDQGVKSGGMKGGGETLGKFNTGKRLETTQNYQVPYSSLPTPSLSSLPPTPHSPLRLLVDRLLRAGIVKKKDFHLQELDLTRAKDASPIRDDSGNYVFRL